MSVAASRWIKRAAGETAATLRTQFPVQTSRPHDSLDGHARIIVASCGADAVRTVNGAIATADDLARQSNPDATAACRVTEMIAVYDIESRAFDSIFLHGLDFRQRRSAGPGKVVVFSKPPYAPDRTEKLQLATPGYYRDHEDLQPASTTRTTARLRRMARSGRPPSWAGP